LKRLLHATRYCGNHYCGNCYCGNAYCRNAYCRNAYCRNPSCAIVPAVSDIASSLTQTRTAVLLARDERQRVDANLGIRRGQLGIRRGQLVVRPTAWLSRDDGEHMGIAWAELLECGTFAGRPRLWAPGRREAAAIEFTA
jgi:hypothetical protein